MATEKKALVSVYDGLDEKRIKNLYITVGFLSFTTMLFHFTSVYFFTLKLESVAMVGVFLGIGNFFSFLFDVPIGVLQYYMKPKKLLILGVIAQIIAMMIFASFIWGFLNFLTVPDVESVKQWGSVAGSVGENAVKYSTLFFGNAMNWFLLLFAAACYGFNKEINDITFISYIMNNASPDQLKEIIPRQNLVFGVGSLAGLVVAGVVMGLDNPSFIAVFVLLLIISIFVFTLRYFDNKNTTIDISSVKHFKVYIDKGGVEKLKEDVVEVVSSVNLKKAIGSMKYVFLKPVEPEKNKITIKDLIGKTKTSFIDLYEVLQFSYAKHLVVFWSFIMVLIFGFWDTFATTFLIDFLDQVSSDAAQKIGMASISYILLAMIAIPSYGLQDFFGKLSDKIGVFRITLIGLLLSSGSLIAMGFLSKTTLFIVLICAIVNAVGYAICMGLSVSIFLEEYNKSFAEKKKLKQIDANASAAPMKILQNLANVVGLVLGGMLLIFGYPFFFIVFGLMIGVFIYWAIKNKNVIMDN